MPRKARYNPFPSIALVLTKLLLSDISKLLKSSDGEIRTLTVQGLNLVPPANWATPPSVLIIENVLILAHQRLSVQILNALYAIAA